MEEIVCLDACHCPVPEFSIPKDKYKYVEYHTTTAEQINARIQNATIIITTRVVINSLSLDHCPRLKMIAVMAAGTDIIDRPAAAQTGILVCNIPSASAESVAEHAFALYFAVKRNVVELHNLTIQGTVWPSKRTAIHVFQGLPTTCKQEVMAIVGYGTLGKRVEIMAKALGMSVIVAERKGQVGAAVRSGRCDFEQALRKCTVLVLTCPLDDTTRGMIGDAELAMMPKSSILINVARGGVVLEQALTKALREGEIKGAATDVFEIEPADATTSPLITLDNSIPHLTLSPHVAWYASSSIENLQVMVKSNIENFVAGHPQNVI